MVKLNMICFAVLGMMLVLQGYVQANWFTDLFSKSKAEEAHNTVYNSDPPQRNKGSWTHELIAAAAGFEAMRAYERHQARQKGAPVEHSIVKGVLAGLAAAAVDRLIETKGLDWIDAQRAKSRAAKQAEKVATEQHPGLALVDGDEYVDRRGGQRNNYDGDRSWQNGVRDADPEAMGRSRSVAQRTSNNNGDRSWQNGVRDADPEAMGNSRSVAQRNSDGERGGQYGGRDADREAVGNSRSDYSRDEYR